MKPTIRIVDKLKLLVPLCVALPLHAQELTLRSETRVVLVDAVAVDKKGKFNRDLTQKDFRLWEDGKEQKISSFSLESSGVNPERPSKHYVAMFFDTSTGQGSQINDRKEAIRFVEGFASPDRYMAVANYGVTGGLQIVQNFATDPQQLKRSLSHAPAGAVGAPIPTASGTVGRGAVERQSAAADTLTGRELLTALRTLVDSLAPIRGRKALIFFTSGIPFQGELAIDLQAAIIAANKANVAICTVSPLAWGGNGSVPFSASASSGNTMLAVDTQTITRGLADGTGGVALVSSNGLANSLGRIAQELDDYYVLGYTPTVDFPEDSCHELKVKVNRGDLELRARRGYCTSKPADVLSGKPAGKDLEARARGTAAGNMTAKMQLPWFYSAPNVARVHLAMEINPSALKFQKETGKLRAELDVAGVAYKPDGTVAARVSDAVKLTFDTQQQVDAFLKATHHYENQFEIAAGQYNFRLIFGAEAKGAQGFGKVEMPLSIGAWNGQTLSISGLALSHDAHPAADLAAGLDISLLEGARPLVSRGAKAVPTGTSQFHSGEAGYFYFEAYEPLLAAAKPDAPPPAVGVRVRVFDRATGAQKQDTGVKMVGAYERPGNPTIPIISELQTSLPPGAYKLEVSVARASGNPVVRTVDFDIN